MTKIIQLNKRARQRGAFLRQQMERKKQMRAAMSDSYTEDMMMEHHQDVLQNIEFALISCCRENDEIDDMIVADALQSAILCQEPVHQLSARLLNALQDIRNVRSDVLDNLWQDGLRVVLNSVKRHSNLRTGDKKYIKFVSPFIK